MALATQCPHCYTSFRVANDQLKLHAGMVRCGACKQTFNGIEHLLAPGATPKNPPSKAFDTENLASTHTDAQSAPQIGAQNTASTTETDAVPVASENLASWTASRIEDASDFSAGNLKSPIDDQFIDKNESEAINEKSKALAPQLDTTEVDNEDDATEANLKSKAPAEGEDLTTQAETVQHNTHEPQALDSSLIGILSETSKQVLHEVNADFIEDKADLDVNLGANLGANLGTTLGTNLDESDSVHPEQEIVANEADATEAEIRNPTTTTTNIATIDAIDTQTAPQLSEHDNSETNATAETKKRPNKPGSLTASLDFELSKEDQAWADEIAQVNQLELETRVAVLDETSEAWSKHEPQSVQDGFIDSLKDLKPIFDNIGDFGSLKHQAPVNSDEPLHTLDDLRIQDAKADSMSDQDLNLDVDTKDDEVTPAFVLQAERAQRFGKWKKIGLSVATFLFVLAGVAQSIYFLRSDIAAQLPQFKPQLLSICKVLSCQIKLPAQRSMLEITGSELLIVSEELSMNTLSVQIQNKSGTLQAWPHVDLTLKDRRGKDLLQKAFTPAQYLENKELLNKGMAANSESNHKVFFQLNGLKASDYTVEIFYP